MKKCAILFLILLSACKDSKEIPFADRPMPVTVTSVVQKDVPLYLEVIGNVNASTVIEVRPQISGILLQAHVKQGQEVKEGDLLYTIDPAPFIAALNKAKATLKKDESTLEYSKKKVERYKELVKKEFVSALSFEQYETDVLINQAQLLIDQAEIETAEINLRYCFIKSPIDGKISRYIIDPGNRVSPTDQLPLTEIRQLDPVSVQFTLSQRDFQRIQEISSEDDFPFEVILPNRKETIKDGRVTFVDNKIDLATGTITLKGSMKNADRVLWPGEFVRVRMFLQTLRNAMLVPIAAVQFGQEGPYVYILQPNNTVAFKPVILSQEMDNYYVVLEGIKPTDKVVTNGQINLQPGTKVIVTQEKAPS